MPQREVWTRRKNSCFWKGSIASFNIRDDDHATLVLDIRHAHGRPPLFFMFINLYANLTHTLRPARSTAIPCYTHHMVFLCICLRGYGILSLSLSFFSPLHTLSHTTLISHCVDTFGFPFFFFSYSLICTEAFVLSPPSELSLLSVGFVLSSE